MILGNDKNITIIEFAIKHNLPVLLVGHTGVGKTSIIRQLANKQGKKLVRLNLNGSTTVDEFVGKWVLTERGMMQWINGILISCMIRGDWLLIDEINAALPEILFVLHSLTDDDRCVLLAEKDGEMIYPHPDFRIFATMNPSNEYAGTKELNPALKSRFSIQLEMTFPGPGTEAQILREATKVSTSDSKAIANFAASARVQKMDDNISFVVSPRETIFWAKMLEEGFSFRDAFYYAVLSKADIEDRRVLKEIYEEEFGDFVGRLEEGNFEKIEDDITQREVAIRMAQMELDKKEMFLKEKILLDFAKAEAAGQ